MPLLYYNRSSCVSGPGGCNRRGKELQQKRKRCGQMAKNASSHGIRIELTPEQRAQIQRALGKDVAELELTPEALEERVAPGMLGQAGSAVCKSADCIP